MAGLWTLLLLSMIMGGASFLAGLLPLSFSLSPRQLRLITALGTGILVGTSLIVIIPEGVETLYKASANSHGHEERSVFVGQSSVYQRGVLSEGQHHDHWRRIATQEDSNSLGDGLSSGPDDGFSTVNPDILPAGADEDGGTHGTHAGIGAAVEREPHAWIGVSIICGFILMYLIDKLPQHASKRSPSESFQISLGQFSINNSHATSTEEAATSAQDPAASNASGIGSKPSSTTVGLVIHAAADGVALGASSTTGSNLSFVIFIALLIHKHVTQSSLALPRCHWAPAAFGLTSVLLKQGLSTREARTHLIIFSLAAPVGALLTWSAIHILGLSSATLGESASAEFAVGCVLLFSGGTFLYVAMHTMQESSQAHSYEEGHDVEYAVHISNPSHTHAPALVDTLVTVGGMLLPLLTQIGHSH